MNNKTVPPAVLFEFVDFVSQGLLCALHAGDLRMQSRRRLGRLVDVHLVIVRVAMSRKKVRSYFV